MLRETVKIGNKIEIKPLDHNGELIKSSGLYVSQLVDYIEDDIIGIATPIRNGMIVILEKKRYYRLYFYTSKGLYQCNCVMMQTYRENRMVLALVKLTSELEKIQRRQFYRLECVHEIEYRIITEEEEKLEKSLHGGMIKDSHEISKINKKLSQINKFWNRACITDLSGGGCRFNSLHEMKSGDKIRMRIDFMFRDDLKRLEIISDIIATRKLPDRLGVYEHRAEFNNITKSDREDLIKYIFEQERRLRKNEKK